MTSSTAAFGSWYRKTHSTASIARLRFAEGDGRRHYRCDDRLFIIPAVEVTRAAYVLPSLTMVEPVDRRRWLVAREPLVTTVTSPITAIAVMATVGAPGSGGASPPRTVLFPITASACDEGRRIQRPRRAVEDMIATTRRWAWPPRGPPAMLAPDWRRDPPRAGLALQPGAPPGPLQATGEVL